MAQFRRGFKTWAEGQAVAVRRALRLRAEAPLPAASLARHLRVKVVGPVDIPGMQPDLLRQLLSAGRSQWSAVTLPLDGRLVIILNTAHSPSRQESDLMHELAHRMCEHQLAQIVRLQGFPFPMRDYDAAQEDEANWLGGCLLLPRPALLWAVKRSMTDDEIAVHFGASGDLTRFRRHTTGVDRQIAAMRRLRTV